MALTTVVAAVLLFTGSTIAYITFDHLCVDEHWKSGSHPHPTECHQFIQCANGIGFQMDCPVGLAYNDAIKGCDDPVKMNCYSGGAATRAPSTQAPPTKQTKKTTPLASITTTPDPSSKISGDINDMCRDQNLHNGIHTHPFDCSKYIECAFLRTFVMDCPQGEVYVPTVQTCETIARAPPCKTGGKNSVRTTPMTLTPKTVCNHFGLSPGIHPHPSRCDRFIECANGITYQMDCPAGLHYDLYNKDCDDVHKVNCQDNTDFYTSLTRQLLNRLLH